MKDSWEIAIVGGTGGMGHVFAKELKEYAKVNIISRSLEKAKRTAEALGVQGGVLKDCQSADITIVSVPIEKTYENCHKLLKILKPGSLLIDISAVKTHIEKLEKELPEHLSFISMHPLFGPEGSFKDFNVILIPIKDKGWLPQIQELLIKLGSMTAITTAKEHDTIMSKIQVAHHFMYLVLAGYLSDSQISPEFFTRSFRKTLDSFKGIEKNLEAVLEIQLANPHAETTREAINLFIRDFILLDSSKIQGIRDKIDKFKNSFLRKK